MNSMRGNFAQRLALLDQRILRMGSLVDQAIARAMQALIERDAELALAVIQEDRAINELRYAIEEQSYTLLATQQPMAGDLRHVAAAISLATNLERMADHAAGIAVLARRLSREPELKPLVDLPRMAEIARTMLRAALDAYVQADAESARAVAHQDGQINVMNEQVLRELLTYMIEDPRTIRRATYLLWVSHNLERIGDRCKNLCERVVYVATGELADFDPHVTSEDALDEHDVLGLLPL